MKELLIMIGLIGSMYGNEIELHSWDDIVNNCSVENGTSEVINGEIFTYDNIYTFKATSNYRLNNTGNINISKSVKLIIPEKIVLTKI